MPDTRAAVCHCLPHCHADFVLLLVNHFLSAMLHVCYAACSGKGCRDLHKIDQQDVGKMRPYNSQLYVQTVMSKCKLHCISTTV